MVAKKKRNFCPPKGGTSSPPKKNKTTTASWMVEKFSPEKLPPSPAVVNPFTKVDRSCPFFGLKHSRVFFIGEWQEELSPISGKSRNPGQIPKNRLGKNKKRHLPCSKTMWKKNTCLSVILRRFFITPKPKKLSFFCFSVFEVPKQRNAHKSGPLFLR